MTVLPENLATLKEFAADLEQQAKRETHFADKIGESLATLRQSQLVHELNANALCSMRVHLVRFIEVCEKPGEAQEQPL